MPAATTPWAKTAVTQASPARAAGMSGRRLRGVKCRLPRWLGQPGEPGSGLVFQGRRFRRRLWVLIPRRRRRGPSLRDRRRNRRR